MTFLLYDSNNTPIGQYTSDDRGYVYIEDLEAGRYYLRELENEGMSRTPEENRLCEVWRDHPELSGRTLPITGQIQITKTSADYNSMNGWPAGTPFPTPSSRSTTIGPASWWIPSRQTKWRGSL